MNTMLVRPAYFDTLGRRSRPATGSLLFGADSLFAEMERDVQAMRRHVRQSFSHGDEAEDEFLRGTRFDRHLATGAGACTDADGVDEAAATHGQHAAAHEQPANTSTSDERVVADEPSAPRHASYHAYSYSSTMTRSHNNNSGQVRQVVHRSYEDSTGRRKTLEEKRLANRAGGEGKEEELFRRTLKDGDRVETTFGGVEQAEDFDRMWSGQADRAALEDDVAAEKI